MGLSKSQSVRRLQSFTILDNGMLYYYRVVNKHLYAYNTVSKVETDILQGFVAPEYTPMSTGGKTISVGSKVYYTNLYQGKTLYVYDYLTNKNTKLTASKVADFYIPWRLPLH